MKILILGAGQVGSSAAYHLSREEANEVTVVDMSADVLRDLQERESEDARQDVSCLCIDCMRTETIRLELASPAEERIDALLQSYFYHVIASTCSP